MSDPRDVCIHGVALGETCNDCAPISWGESFRQLAEIATLTSERDAAENRALEAERDRLKAALEAIGRTFPDSQLGDRCDVCRRPVTFCDSEPIEPRFQCVGRIARRALAAPPTPPVGTPPPCWSCGTDREDAEMCETCSAGPPPAPAVQGEPPALHPREGEQGRASSVPGLGFICWDAGCKLSHPHGDPAREGEQGRCGDVPAPRFGGPCTRQRGHEGPCGNGGEWTWERKWSRGTRPPQGTSEGPPRPTETGKS